ncbi:MAG: hypothetical protein HQ501_04545 [Rhodospirillales bacterium]|nr:hypothetical protein [Rhodospirillales bacterium]
MRQSFWIIGLITTLVTTQITTLAPNAYAQSFGEGVVNAVSFRPLPADMSIRVQALDNSDDNLVLIDEVKKALKARGYPLSDDGGMILTLETRSEIGAWSTTDRRHTLEIKGETGSHSDDAQVKLNLFDSNTGGILNQGTSGTTIVTPSQYVIEISLDNATDGKRHWQAWAAAELGQSDGLTLMRGMIPALSDVVGKTVSQQTFHLQ